MVGEPSDSASMDLQKSFSGIKKKERYHRDMDHAPAVDAAGSGYSTWAILSRTSL